jgi:hypothetical protein
MTFKPGQSGNPAGSKPKRKSVASSLASLQDLKDLDKQGFEFENGPQFSFIDQERKNSQDVTNSPISSDGLQW